jgi:hypothetical protein
MQMDGNIILVEFLMIAKWDLLIMGFCWLGLTPKAGKLRIVGDMPGVN